MVTPLFEPHGLVFCRAFSLRVLHFLVPQVLFLPAQDTHMNCGARCVHAITHSRCTNQSHHIRVIASEHVQLYDAKWVRMCVVCVNVMFCRDSFTFLPIQERIIAACIKYAGMHACIHTHTPLLNFLICLNPLSRRHRALGLAEIQLNFGGSAGWRDIQGW